jgi:hypothetical protein
VVIRTAEVHGDGRRRWAAPRGRALPRSPGHQDPDHGDTGAEHGHRAERSGDGQTGQVGGDGRVDTRRRVGGTTGRSLVVSSSSDCAPPHACVCILRTVERRPARRVTQRWTWQGEPSGEHRAPKCRSAHAAATASYWCWFGTGTALLAPRAGLGRFGWHDIGERRPIVADDGHLGPSGRNAHDGAPRGWRHRAATGGEQWRTSRPGAHGSDSPGAGWLCWPSWFWCRPPAPSHMRCGSPGHRRRPSGWRLRQPQ